ncbi:MAG: glycosyltransferase family 4 protein [Planctomycetota bacterium]
MVTRRVLISSTSERTHHFEGLGDALRSHGLDPLFEHAQWSAPARVPEWLAKNVAIVLHAESLASNAASVRLTARCVGIPCALLMDGVCDFANTFLKPIAGPPLLRPAPADIVLACGAHDRVILQALGNRTVVTGLPRLEAFSRQWARTPQREPDTDLLIATANTPRVTPGGAQRTLDTLREIRDTCDRLSVRTMWRIDPSLSHNLGVTVSEDDLVTTLARVRAVITTASTLAIEGMLARRPVGVLHPHPWPLWIPCAWRYDGTARSGSDSDRARADRVGRAAVLANRVAHASAQSCIGDPFLQPVDQADRFVHALLEPSAARMRAQESALRRLCNAEATDPLARVIDHAVRIRPVLPTIKPTPRPRSPGVTRVTSVIEAHASSVGGVSVWSERMERHFAQHPELGIEWQTLFIGPCAPPAGERMHARSRARAVELDPAASLPAQLRTLLQALADTDVLLPNYSELAHRAGSVARERGARVLAISHTNDMTTRSMLRDFPSFDGAIAVSDACAEWLREDHDEPVETIIYGVPIARDSPPHVDRTGPLRVISIGRVVQTQKRVFDLIDIFTIIRSRGIDARLTLVGDGEDLPEWERRASAAGLDLDCVVTTGAVEPDDVERILASQHVYLNVSDAEGTSIAMLEAMGAGLAPIVSDVPGVRTIIEDGSNGFVCRVGSPDAFADRLAQLAKDRSLLDSIRQAAHATIIARGLTVARCAERYVHAIQNLKARESAKRTNPFDAPRDVWRARGAASEAEIREIATGNDVEVVTASDPHPGEAVIAARRARGVQLHVEPTLEAHEASHLTHLVERIWTRHAHPVFVAASSPRIMPAIEWLARDQPDRIRAFVVPSAPAGSSLFGVPAVDFEHVARTTSPVLIAGPPIDPVSLVAAIAHGVPDDRLVLTSGIEPEGTERARAAATLAFGSDTLTTLPPGVLPNAQHISISDARCAGERTRGARAVVLRGDEADFALATRFAEALGPDVPIVSLGWPTRELTAPARYTHLVRDEIGASPFALYGGGRHTQRLLSSVPRGTPEPIMILDDAGASLCAHIDARHPDRVDADSLDAIVLSSPVHEAAMWERTERFRDAGVRVLCLYDAPHTAGAPAVMP